MNNIEEVRKDILGYEGLYKVSSFGVVKSLLREKENRGTKQIVPEKELKQFLNNYGYPYVNLCINGTRSKQTVSRLVAKAFLGLEDKNSLVVCHKDDNPKNNNVNNLFVGTVQDNINDMIIKGRKKSRNPKVSMEYMRNVVTSDIRDEKKCKVFGVHINTLRKYRKIINN